MHCESYTGEKMPEDHLRILSELTVPGSTMLLALGGWMDGGFVSTGTVRQFMRGRKLIEIARIEHSDFYLDTFPGSMELASLLRPHVRYNNGLIESIEMHENQIFADEQNKLVFFVGKEPNLNWQKFADCIFDLCTRLAVKQIVFVGSFGGSVPHTREPRMFGAVSHKQMLPMLKQFGLRPTEYEGPASFAAYLLSRVAGKELEMLSIAVEIPSYLEGTNPISIEAVARRMSTALNIPVDHDELRKASSEWEAQVTDAVDKDKKLARNIRKLEDQYDSELVDSLGIEEA